MEQEKKTNWFTRLLLTAIGGLIALMIVYRYFYVDPKAEISAGIIILIGFLIVLALSEVFDSFSVGEVLKLSRTIKSKEKEISKRESEITKIEAEKNQLLNQVITLYNNFSQQQSNTNIIGFPPDLMKQVSVQKADPIEVEALKQKEEQEAEKEGLPRQRQNKVNLRKVEELALKKYFAANNIDISKVFKEIKLQAFHGIDPISDSSPIFDAYLNDIDKEVFFEVKTGRGYLTSTYMDRLYLMLSKIFHYRTIKKNTTYLNIIIVEYPDNNADENRPLDRMINFFQPALSNKLLKIGVVKIDQSEMEGLFEN